MTTANPFCSALMRIAVAHGVKRVVCSPGSRNAPLLLAATLNPELDCRVAVDERTAAFIALGESLVSRNPVMVVCTSGTALLNYGPAVAEAYYAGVPLIVVSADRPMEWIDQDDSQTLRQAEALANFVKKSYDLPVYSNGGDRRMEQLQWYVERQVNDAMLTALSRRPGPVHINIQLDNPLGALTAEGSRRPRIMEMAEGVGDLPARRMEELAAKAAGMRVLLLAGFMQPDHNLNQAVNELAAQGNVAVLAETLSNLHPFPAAGHHNIDTALCLLRTPQDIAEFAPDLVITIGGALVSRKVKEWLRGLSGIEHWSVGYSHTTVDCLQSLTLRIDVPPARFLRRLAKEMQRYRRRAACAVEVMEFGAKWKRLQARAARRLAEYAAGAAWSDLRAFSVIAEEFPSAANLFLSNGTAVRYDQLFGIPAHATYCNRGVSGIDGCTSTAIGGALAYARHRLGVVNGDPLTVLITGDMSFAYDLGALGCQLMPDSMRVIVLNNGGGGIFRFIGSTSSLPKELLERYFCADPEVPVKALARAYGLEWYGADSEESLREGLRRLFATPYAAILEVRTDGDTSARILRGFFDSGA